MANNGPRSIGMIMDGNRRWARERGLETLEGHRAGAEKIFEVASWAHTAGIEEIILYAFSTENWNRTEAEVGYLMSLTENLFTERLDYFLKASVRVRFIGDLSRVSDRLRGVMQETEEKTSQGEKGTLVFAFSYGGRPEIVAAVNTLLAEGVSEVDETAFSKALWTADFQDPDLILRTGGEHRLSGFLPWQSVYSELFFTDTRWPDLSEEEFMGVIEAFRTRDRRHGK